MKSIRTDQLKRGDVVSLPGGRTRTVAAIQESGYVNSKNEPILTVTYQEGHSGDWSGGNTAIARSPWEVMA